MQTVRLQTMTLIKATNTLLERFFIVIFTFLLFIMLMGMFGGVLILIIHFCFVKTPEIRPPIWIIILCLIFGGFFSRKALSSLFTTDYTLSDTDLIIGSPLYKNKLQLSKIVKIVKGIPASSSIAYRSTIMGENGKILASSICSNTLFLKFTDGYFLTLNIHSMKNGTILMEELLKSQADKIEEEYVFNEKENKLLKKHNINALVKA